MFDLFEGSQLSDRDVEKLLSNLETYSFASRDEEEVAGYALVCEEIFQGFELIDFSENLVASKNIMRFGLGKSTWYTLP